MHHVVVESIQQSVSEAVLVFLEHLLQTWQDCVDHI